MRARRTRRGHSRHKYGAKPTIVNGIRFASRKEAARYLQLLEAKREGKISNLRRQVRYPITIEAVYIADFAYHDRLRGTEVVEDVKGYRTAEYKRKKRLMREQHGIDILES